VNDAMQKGMETSPYAVSIPFVVTAAEVMLPDSLVLCRRRFRRLAAGMVDALAVRFDLL
jgi:hypothetical protein